MVEVNNSEINVDELMHEIREKANKRHGHSRSVDSNFGAETSAIATVIDNIENFLKDAEFRAEVRTKWPDKFNRFPLSLARGLQNIIFKVLALLFRDQREVNFNLIQSLKETVALNRELMVQVTTLRSQMSGRLRAVDREIREGREQLEAVDSRVQKLDEYMRALNRQVQEVDERLETVDSHGRDVDNRAQDVNRRVGDLENRIQDTDSRVQGLDERYLRNDHFLKNDLVQQKRLIALFLEEARRRLPEPFDQEQLSILINEDRHLLDAFYAAFEDRFRGSREDIFNRFKIYLPFIEEAKVGTPEFPILDVGCGRGEWLELLRESGHIARGIDINRVMLEQCQARELEVAEADAIAYLERLPDDSLGAITGFHIIEHLPFEILIKLIDEAVRVLKPNGLVIFETPNPQNVLVGSNSFYLDPNHRNPLPSAMMEFAIEARGLCQVKTIYLQPYPEHFKISGSALADRFSEYFYGPQDYAVIGYKA